jgi:hypothetical protein
MEAAEGRTDQLAKEIGIPALLCIINYRQSEFDVP